MTALRGVGYTARTVLLRGVLATSLVLIGYAGVAAQPGLPECDRSDSTLLLPDLIVQEPSQIQNIYRAQGRVIAFTTAIGNIGDGPLILQGHTVQTSDGTKTQAWQIIRKSDGTECQRLAGYMVYHPAHFHWHFTDFAAYELHKDGPDGLLVAAGFKMTFCLIDIGELRGYGPVRFPQQIFGNNCGPESTQGISVGWEDVYLHNYADQFVQLDRDVPYGPVPEGVYTLVHRVDPDGKLWEKDTTNNMAFTDVGVTQPPPDTGVVIPPTPTPRLIHPPNIFRQPARERPTRAPRPIFEVPTRPARPTRPPRGFPQDPTPTPMAGGNAGPPGTCQTSCVYSVSQVRMTWYDATGLNFSALVTPNTCAPLTPQEGEDVNVHLYNWLRWDRTNTGIDVNGDFVLGRNESAQTRTGSVNFSSVGDSMWVTFNESAPAPARGSDGDNFPVVFQSCVTVGNQQVPMRLVCQPKSTGMLCHQ